VALASGEVVVMTRGAAVMVSVNDLLTLFPCVSATETRKAKEPTVVWAGAARTPAPLNVAPPGNEPVALNE